MFPCVNTPLSPRFIPTNRGVTGDAVLFEGGSDAGSSSTERDSFERGSGDGQDHAGAGNVLLLLYRKLERASGHTGLTILDAVVICVCAVILEMFHVCRFFVKAVDYWYCCETFIVKTEA